MPSVVFFICYAMSNFAECHYSEYCAKCHNAERHFLSVILPNVNMLNVLVPYLMRVNINSFFLTFVFHDLLTVKVLDICQQCYKMLFFIDYVANK